MPKVGVIGSLVWDEIHGRDPAAGIVEEWGGIAYALAGLDAHLPSDWEIVPLIKVGQDLAEEARDFLGTLRHRAPDARFIEVAVPNNRVVLYYQSDTRRCERMAGGVPPWNWAELGPMVRDLDALYLNFLSGFEMCLGTAEALRQGFPGPIYADLHSLLLGMQGDGIRILKPLPDAARWFGCFDVIQVNEDEMNQLGEDPMSLAVAMLAQGVSTLIVTLGPRGAVYVTDGSVSRYVGKSVTPATDLPTYRPTATTALVPTDVILGPIDPTGCGDVFGGTVCSRLLAGESLESAVTAGNRAAARSATFRGASGLAGHLRGELVAP